MSSISKWFLGNSFIPLDAIETHPMQRRPYRPLVELIKADLKQGNNKMDSFPVSLMLPSEFSTPELLGLIKQGRPASGLLQLPEGIKFLCIDGQHRIIAAKEHLQGLQSQNLSNIPDSALGWVANIFEECTVFNHPLNNPVPERLCSPTEDGLCQSMDDRAERRGQTCQEHLFRPPLRCQGPPHTGSRCLF